MDLLVSTLTTSLVATSLVCVSCLVVMCGHNYKANLICLPLFDLNVILGMDCLSSNRILIVCAKKTLVFPDHEDVDFITAN